MHLTTETQESPNFASAKVEKAYNMVKYKILIYLSILGVVLLASCGGDSEVTTSQEQKQLVDTTFHRVTVDRLRMRTAPGLKSETVMLLPEEAVVRYWGKHSEEKTRITLRDQPLDDYWKYIRYGSSEGWVFGGALDEIEENEVADALIEPGKRVGLILASDTEQSLVDKLGSENVQRGEYMVGEGTMLDVTYIFPGTPKELILLWKEEDFTHLHEIRITQPESPWKTETGLTMGKSLKEVEKINGGSFLMSGFQWDYAGTTMSWNQGNLLPALVLVFAEPTRVHESLIGDMEVSSENRYLQRSNPKVRAIRIIFS